MLSVFRFSLFSSSHRPSSSSSATARAVGEGNQINSNSNTGPLNEYEHKIGVIQSVVASLGSSIATMICTKPFDVARARRQARPRRAGKKAVAQDLYIEDFKELVSIIRNEGFASLYSSMGIHLFGHITSGLVYHSAESLLKSSFFDKLPAATNMAGRMAKRILFSSLAGLVQVCTTHPIWVVKNREQLRARNIKAGEKMPSVNPVKELYRLARDEGLSGLYSGFVPSIILTVHTSFQYAVYDEFKMAFARAKGRPLSPLDRSLAGIISKSLATVVANPMLVIRIRLMEENSAYTGPLDVIRRVTREEGISAFYRGSSVGLYKILAAGITHPVYDEIVVRTKKLFS